MNGLGTQIYDNDDTHSVPYVSDSPGTLWFVMQNFSVVCTVKEESSVR